MLRPVPIYFLKYSQRGVFFWFGSSCLTCAPGHVWRTDPRTDGMWLELAPKRLQHTALAVEMCHEKEVRSSTKHNLGEPPFRKIWNCYIFFSNDMTKRFFAFGMRRDFPYLCLVFLTYVAVLFRLISILRMLLLTSNTYETLKTIVLLLLLLLIVVIIIIAITFKKRNMQPPPKDRRLLQIHFSPTPHHTAIGDLSTCFCWKWDGLKLRCIYFPWQCWMLMPKHGAPWPMTHPTYDSPIFLESYYFSLSLVPFSPRSYKLIVDL